ncbi:hypothetical protein HZS_269 [Henneguya salminicola]|nr:hypothetical protein HZS_269 [Henneguya salminicola]
MLKIEGSDLKIENATQVITVQKEFIVMKIASNINFVTEFGFYEYYIKPKSNHLSVKFILKEFKILTPLYSLNKTSSNLHLTIPSHIYYSIKNSTLSISTRKNFIKGSLKDVFIQFCTQKDLCSLDINNFNNFIIEKQSINCLCMDTGLYYVSAKTRDLQNNKSFWDIGSYFNFSGSEMRIDSDIGSHFQLLINNMEFANSVPEKRILTSTDDGCKNMKAYTIKSVSSFQSSIMSDDYVKIKILPNVFPSSNDEESIDLILEEKERLLSKHFLQSIQRKLTLSLRNFEPEEITKIISEANFEIRGDNKNSKSSYKSIENTKELLIDVKSNLIIKRGIIIICHKHQNNVFHSSPDLCKDVSFAAKPSNIFEESFENMELLKLPIPDISVAFNFSSRNYNTVDDIFDESIPATFIIKLHIFEIPPTYTLTPDIIHFFQKTFSNFTQNNDIKTDTETNDNDFSDFSPSQQDNVLTILFIKVESSTVKFNCLPDSKIKGAFTTPALTATFTYNTLKTITEKELNDMGIFTEELIKNKFSTTWNMLMTFELSHFIFKLYHPYLKKIKKSTVISQLLNIPESFQNELNSNRCSPHFSENFAGEFSKNMLLFNITKIRAQLSRFSYLRQINPITEVNKHIDTYQNYKQTIKTSFLCDFGYSIFNLDAKHFKEIESAMEAWIYRAQLIKLFLGKNSENKNEPIQKSQIQSSINKKNQWSSHTIVSVNVEKLILNMRTGYTFGDILTIFEFQTFHFSINTNSSNNIILKLIHKCKNLSFSLKSGVVGGSFEFGEISLNFKKNSFPQIPIHEIEAAISHIDIKFEHFGSIYLMASLQDVNIKFTDDINLTLSMCKQNKNGEMKLNMTLGWKSFSLIANRSTYGEILAIFERLKIFIEGKKKLSLKTIETFKHYKQNISSLKFKKFKTSKQYEENTLGKTEIKIPEPIQIEKMAILESESALFTSYEHDNEFNWILFIKNFYSRITNIKDEHYINQALERKQDDSPFVNLIFKISGKSTSLSIFDGPNMRQASWVIVIMDKICIDFNQIYYFSQLNSTDLKINKNYRFEQNLYSSFDCNDSDRDIEPKPFTNNLICGVVYKIERGYSSPLPYSEKVINWLYYVHSFDIEDYTEFNIANIINNIKNSIHRSEISNNQELNKFNVEKLNVWQKYKHKSSLIFAIFPTNLSALFKHDICYNYYTPSLNLHQIKCSFITEFSNYILSTTDLNLLLFLRQIFQPIYSQSCFKNIILKQKKQKLNIWPKNYQIEKYQLQPKIHLLEWDTKTLNPIDIEWILFHLGFIDAKNNIPKLFYSLFLNSVDEVTYHFCSYLIEQYDNYLPH